MRCPKRTDRIAVLGAGASGLHMAASLRTAGFTDVTVYEARDRVGGKCHTREMGGVPVELGAMILPEGSALLAFLRRWDVGLTATALPQYNASLGMRVGRLPKRVAAKALDWIELRRVRRLFARYGSTELLQAPDDPRWPVLALPLSLFLRRRRLPITLAYMNASLLAGGYGTADALPTYYGLEILRVWIDALLEQRWYIVDGGYQQGWESIVERAGLRVVLDAAVESLEARADGVTCRFANGETERVDFVVNSAPHVINGPQSAAIFDRVRTFDYHIATFDVPWQRRDTVVAHIAEDRPHEVNALAFHHTARGVTPSDAREIVTGFCGPNYTAPGLHLGSTDQAQRVRRSLERYFGISDARPRDSRTWPYFPQFSAADVAAGVLAEIFTTQGDHRIWNIGAACCFESVPNVVDYNVRLLDHFGLR